MRHNGVGLGTKAAAPHLVAHDGTIGLCTETAKIMTDHSAPPPPHLPPQAGEGRKGARKRPLALVAAIVGLGTLAAVYGFFGALRNPCYPASRQALHFS